MGPISEDDIKSLTAKNTKKMVVPIQSLKKWRKPKRAVMFLFRYKKKKKTQHPTQETK